MSTVRIHIEGGARDVTDGVACEGAVPEAIVMPGHRDIGENALHGPTWRGLMEECDRARAHVEAVRAALPLLQQRYAALCAVPGSPAPVVSKRAYAALCEHRALIECVEATIGQWQQTRPDALAEALVRVGIGVAARSVQSEVERIRQRWLLLADAQVVTEMEIGAQCEPGNHPALPALLPDVLADALAAARAGLSQAAGAEAARLNALRATLGAIATLVDDAALTGRAAPAREESRDGGSSADLGLFHYGPVDAPAGVDALRAATEQLRLQLQSCSASLSQSEWPSHGLFQTVEMTVDECVHRSLAMVNCLGAWLKRIERMNPAVRMDLPRHLDIERRIIDPVHACRAAWLEFGHIGLRASLWWFRHGDPDASGMVPSLPALDEWARRSSEFEVRLLHLARGLDVLRQDINDD